jgi:predicted NAD/FAD-dependent oxidoreductase
MRRMDAEVVVVGAGVAGLTCARELARSGRNAVLLEKSRGVGGRCATRRIGDTSVDHGITFYHGKDEELRTLLESVGGEDVVAGWPRRVHGEGTPCQPSALREGGWRLAFRDGVSTFPGYLARELDIRLDVRQTALGLVAQGFELEDHTGRKHTARDLVLTVPTQQALELLDTLRDAPRELEPLRWLLHEVGFVACLTVIALFPATVALPDWDMWYPEDSAILHLVSHDSSKRRRPPRTALVLQALPAWSREHWDRPEAEWSKAMVEEAGRLAGAWAAGPETVHTHRWRFARIGGGGDLTGPMMITLPDGQRLGLAGDGFSPGGGVQAAWRSGRELAQRLCGQIP